MRIVLDVSVVKSVLGEEAYNELVEQSVEFLYSMNRMKMKYGLYGKKNKLLKQKKPKTK